MKLDETRRVYSLIGILGLTLMFFLMLVSIAGASPFAYITNYNSDTVSVIDTATNKVKATINVSEHPYGVAVNPDGTSVYVTHWDTVSVINTATNNVTATVPVGGGSYGVAVTPDGTKVYVASSFFNDNVYVINTATNKVTATVEVVDPYGVAVNPDGTKVYATSGNGSVSVIDTGTDTVTATVPVGSVPNGVAVSPDGTKVYVANEVSGTVSVIDTSTNTVTATVNIGYGSYGIAVTPDGTKVYVTKRISHTISVIDTATNKVKATINVGKWLNGVAVTPDGAKVYVSDFTINKVLVIDAANNTVIATVPVGNAPAAFGQFIGSLTPFAKFSATRTEGKAPLTVAFTDESIRSPTKWNWTFGDGATSTQQNPTHKYSKVGRYTVKLTATNDKGSNTVTKADYIKVVTKPVANFTSSVTSGKAPLNVKFTDTSTGIPTEWQWDFGDGSKSFYQNPIHKYSKAGNYTVKFTVSNVEGSNTVTKTEYITVVAKPVADFSATPTSGKVPLTVAFNDTSTGSPIKWKWSFGDETTSNKQNPTHKYSKTGIYTVALTATNYNGSNTLTKAEYINVVTKPIANFSASPTSGIALLMVHFTDTSTETPAKWRWDFGDGSKSVHQNPIHKYSKAGNYTVSLTVKNAAGNNTTTKKDYINVIAPVKPVANFSATPTEGNVPLMVAFNDTSTGIPTRWKWTFGDGATSTIQNPRHKYSIAGNYTVSLTVENAAGNNTTTKKDYINVITVEIPVANFSATRTEGKAPLTVAFNDTSTGIPTIWVWLFGDGAGSKIQNPTHVYSKAGNYTVILGVRNSAGSNKVTKRDYIVVVSKPTAVFFASPTSGKAPLTVKFTDRSLGNPTKCKWSFGDGTISSEKNPEHQYLQRGKYKVTLKVANVAGSNTTTIINYIKVTT